MGFRQINLAMSIDFHICCQRPIAYMSNVWWSKAFHFLAPLSIAYLRSVKLLPAKSIKARRASFLNRGSQSIPVSLASFGRMVPRLAHLATRYSRNIFPSNLSSPNSDVTAGPFIQPHQATQSPTRGKDQGSAFQAQVSFHRPGLLIPSLLTFQHPSNWQGGLSGVSTCLDD